MTPTGMFKGENLWVKFPSHTESTRFSACLLLKKKKTKTLKVTFPISNFADPMLIAIWVQNSCPCAFIQLSIHSSGIYLMKLYRKKKKANPNSSLQRIMHHQLWRQHTHLRWERYKIGTFDNNWMLREEREHLLLPRVSQGGLLK